MPRRLPADKDMEMRIDWIIFTALALLWLLWPFVVPAGAASVGGWTLEPVPAGEVHEVAEGSD